MPNLESALVIELEKVISWDAALKPDESGELTSINPAQPIDATAYARRDRELAYRDVINAHAVVKVAIEIAEVWNHSAITPKLQGAPYTSQLPHSAADARSLDSTVYHVKNASIPYDACTITDRDLYGRDALLFESLARVAQIFSDPPITRIDSAGTAIFPTEAWSKAEGADKHTDVSPSLPLNRATFKEPDQYLAERDNKIAAYVSRLAVILKNPFEFADRLYIQVSGLDQRQSEVYTLVYPHWVAGTIYSVGDEVLYASDYYSADTTTTNIPGTGQWTLISAPTKRTFVAEPVLEGRNRIVYDTVAKTLQWFREHTDLVHVPQIFALSIPGVYTGQSLNTLTSVPTPEDAYYYAQKAARVVFGGDIGIGLKNPGSQNSVPSFLKTTATPSTTGGIIVTDGDEKSACLPVPGAVSFKFSGASVPSGKYRTSIIARPESNLFISGDQNTSGNVTAEGGATFSSLGDSLSYVLALPPGGWIMQFEYTNVSGTSKRFGVNVDYGQAVFRDVLPLTFVDEAGSPLDNGTLVLSPEIALSPDYAYKYLKFTWTYGTGQLHIRHILLTCQDTLNGRYKLSASFCGQSASIDTLGTPKQTEVLNFDFSSTGSYWEPALTISWSGSSTALPLVLPSASIASYVAASIAVGYPVTSNSVGFDGIKQDFLNRAVRTVIDSYALSLSLSTVTPIFDIAGAWHGSSTQAWMKFIRAAHPKLYSELLLTTDVVIAGNQYIVVEGLLGAGIQYAGTTYRNGQTFLGVDGYAAYTNLGNSEIWRTGGFRLGSPSDVGRPALVPDGLEYDASTATVLSNYGASDSIPTIQAFQPWMVGIGIYVAVESFWSTDIPMLI